MRLALLFLTLFWVALVAPAQADDEVLRVEIKKAYQAIAEAFELQDSSAIKALTTPEHVAITSYYDGAKPIDFQLEHAADLVFTQKPISDLHVEAIGKDVAVLRFTAEMEGSFKGVALPSRAAVTMIWQKVEGGWLERLYQETPLD